MIFIKNFRIECLILDAETLDVSDVGNEQ
jgi:hypothetical protein